MHTVYVVNDRFENFSQKHGAVLTFSKFRDFIINHAGSQKINVLFGQGVDSAEIERIVQVYAPLPANINVCRVQKRPKASVFEAHKHKTRNIMVSLAEQVSETEFRLDLYFDGDNEFFDDHMSGQHIQGMSITEAARQAFLTVTEQFYLPKTVRHYFVIHNMSTEFKAFVFPIDAFVRFLVVSKKVGAKGNVSMDARIEIHQAGNICAVCNVSFTAYETGWISEREHAAAVVALESSERQLLQPLMAA